MFFPLALLFPLSLHCLRGGKRGRKVSVASPEAQGTPGRLAELGEQWQTLSPCRKWGKVPQTSAACCVLLFWEADGFLLSRESFPHGRDWACWEAPGNLEGKMVEQNSTLQEGYCRQDHIPEEFSWGQATPEVKHKQLRQHLSRCVSGEDHQCYLQL